jgi:hypothetical protein
MTVSQESVIAPELIILQHATSQVRLLNFLASTTTATMLQATFTCLAAGTIQAG